MTGHDLPLYVCGDSLIDDQIGLRLRIEHCDGGHLEIETLNGKVVLDREQIRSLAMFLPRQPKSWKPVEHTPARFPDEGYSLEEGTLEDGPLSSLRQRMRAMLRPESIGVADMAVAGHRPVDQPDADSGPQPATMVSFGINAEDH